ncbi:MAG: anthranilate synthase component I family protein [Planctomycetota bacterium]|jgi:para-aminobenzoate synthetase component 1
MHNNAKTPVEEKSTGGRSLSKQVVPIGGTGKTVKQKATISCKVRGRKISGQINLAGLNEVFTREHSASILGGNESKKDAGRFSYWMCEPKEIFEFRTGEENPFGKLQQLLDKYKLEGDFATALPVGIFVGGWAGYFSYELGRYIEKLPNTTVDDLKMPLIRLCFYDGVIAYDHIEQVCWLIAIEMGNEKQRAEEKLAHLENLLTKSQKITVKPPCRTGLDDTDFSQIGCNMDKDYYFEAIEKIKRYIYDGDVYQINFSQRFECDYTTEPISLYHWQNFYNPSPYAAYIDGDDFHIVSASPEMFITIEDGIISTQPIKGTRRRVSEDKNKNAKNFEELVKSEKEQAELNMIIDLERNDVARICRAGTRKVVQPRTIESYPTVFHAMATVAGELRGDVTFCDTMRAMFPGGSITGAPKIRSMEIIDETEPTARGVYTGSIGFIGIDGGVCLNIAIRTIIITGQKAYAQSGGGIVADSQAESEWAETITKARALLAGIRSVNAK